MSMSNPRLKVFVSSSSPADLDVLDNYLTERADEYMDTARRIAHEALKTPANRARVVHYRSMAQALFALRERIQKERCS